MKFWKLYFVETCVIVMQTLIMYIELSVADTRGGGGGEGGPEPPIILKDCKNLVPNNTNHTHIT